MAVSSWILGANTQGQPDGWRLPPGGREWSYRELFAFDDRLTATLDCTGGFFSTQEWSGARLSRLIGKADATTIRVVSLTGYTRRFSIERASSMLLATRAGGRALDPGHGFPARLVVPDARGFWWVKWV